MKQNMESEEETRELEGEISDLLITIEKLSAASEEDEKLKWAIDPAIENLRKSIVEKQARLGKIANESGN